MAFRKQHFEKPFSLYHLSFQNHDREIFYPKAIDKDRAMEGENYWAKRICMSTSIDNALLGFGLGNSTRIVEDVLFVLVPENLEELFQKDKIYRPSLKQVPDVLVTDEYWIREKCKMKCIGKIQTTGVESTYGMSRFQYECLGTQCWYDKILWKWLEKKS